MLVDVARDHRRPASSLELALTPDPGPGARVLVVEAKSVQT
jgi:hypothetical protein